MIDSFSNESYVFALRKYWSSRNTKWSKILKGNYVYTTSNDGHLIIAIDQIKPTNQLFYSTNFGATWLVYKFTKSDTELITVTDLVTKIVNQYSTDYYLFGISDSKARKVFKLNSIKNDIEHLNDAQKNENNAETDKHYENCGQTCASKTNPGMQICYNSSMVCNSIVDCMDRSDEENCQSLENLVEKQLRQVFSINSLIVHDNSRVLFSYKFVFHKEMLDFLSGKVTFNGVVVKVIEANNAEIDFKNISSSIKFKELKSQKLEEEQLEFNQVSDESSLTCAIYVKLVLEIDKIPVERLFFLGSSPVSKIKANTTVIDELKSFVNKLFARQQLSLLKIVSGLITLLLILLVLVYMIFYVIYFVQKRRFQSTKKTKYCNKVKPVSYLPINGSSEGFIGNSKTTKSIYNKEMLLTSSGDKDSLVENDEYALANIV